MPRVAANASDPGSLAGGLLGGLISGWAWDHLGGELTFALSSLYALVGLLVVAIWIGDVGETRASCVSDAAERG